MKTGSFAKLDAPTALTGVVLAVAVLLRVLWLDHVPGINGDESWYGVQVRNLSAVQWRTPTGNVLNPLHVAPLVVFDRLLPNGFLALRLPALLSQLLVLVLGFPLLRKPLGAERALAFVLLAAGTPALVAYARFGWDASHTALASLVVLRFALERAWWPLAGAGVAALVVHPFNVFLVPIVVAVAWRDSFGRMPQLSARAWRLLALAAAGALVAGAGGFYVLATRDPERLRGLLAALHLAANLTSLLHPDTWLALLAKVSELLSGITIYRYIVGPVSSASLVAHHAFVALLLVPSIIFGTRAAWRAGDRTPAALLAGTAVSLLALYVVTGFTALRPGYERYAQFLLVPCLLLLATCLRHLRAFGGTLARAPSIVLCVAGLTSVTTSYLVPLRRTGGDAHQTFRTGPVEPKLAAFELLLERGILLQKQREVAAEDWWLSEPLKYLFAGGPPVEVTSFGRNDDLAPAQAILERGGHAVGFAGGPFATCFAGEGYSRSVLTDYAGRPAVVVYRRAGR